MRAYAAAFLVAGVIFSLGYVSGKGQMGYYYAQFILHYLQSPLVVMVLLLAFRLTRPEAASPAENANGS